MNLKNKIALVEKLRKKFKKKAPTIGAWMQISSSEIAEILGQANFDWVTIDLEHGSFNDEDLSNLFRAIELGSTLPLARLPNDDKVLCSKVLDAGAAGLIIPNINSAKQLEKVIKLCCWPPKGIRGVGFSRANLYGKHFDSYKHFAQKPLIIPMIESKEGVENLDKILSLKNIDAILIGPYDLSASFGFTGKIKTPKFKKIIKNILKKCNKFNVPCGIHIIEPNPSEIKKFIKEGFRFLPYSLDAKVFFSNYYNPIQK